MINGKTLIAMDRRNVLLGVVQDRSKTQTFTSSLLKMSTQQQQQQPTAEKSVQTQDTSGPTTLIVTNNQSSHLPHIQHENTAAEVANTLVSMATGRQRATAVKQLNVITVPNQTTLPILSLADYTTSRGVPTAMALANQAKSAMPTVATTRSSTKAKRQSSAMDTGDNDDEDDQDGSPGDDDVSMSTDEYSTTERNDHHPGSSGGQKNRNKSGRGKASKTTSTLKGGNKQLSGLNGDNQTDAIQYGPILVKPRKRVAPTLANGRKSKDEPLPPDEDVKRKQRRDRNKQAAAKCRRKRNELREQLEKNELVLLDQQQTLERSLQQLNDQKNQLEILLHRHACNKKIRLPVTTTTTNVASTMGTNVLQLPKNDYKTLTTTTSMNTDPNNNTGNAKRVTINFTNAQDLFAVAPLTRTTPMLTTTDGGASSSSSTMPMITIHILPEFAQALLGSTSVDKAKFAELLQQQPNANTTSSSASANFTISTNTGLTAAPTNSSTPTHIIETANTESTTSHTPTNSTS